MLKKLKQKSTWLGIAGILYVGAGIAYHPQKLLQDETFTSLAQSVALIMLNESKKEKEEKKEENE